MFSILFVFIIAVFVIIVVKNLETWNNNNHSPRLSVPAVVVAKRTEIFRQNQPNAGDPTGAHGFSVMTVTHHYVTFQVENGEQKEFYVEASEYERLSEKATGILSFQGTRYLSFVREEAAN